MDSGLFWSTENNFAPLSLPQQNESGCQDGQLVCWRFMSSPGRHRLLLSAPPGEEQEVHYVWKSQIFCGNFRMHFFALPLSEPGWCKVILQVQEGRKVTRPWLHQNTAPCAVCGSSSSSSQPSGWVSSAPTDIPVVLWGSLWKSFPDHFSFQRSTAYQSYVCSLFELPSRLAQQGRISTLLWGNHGIEGSGGIRLWAAGYPSAAWATLSSSLKVGNTKMPSWKAAGKGLGIMVSCHEGEKQSRTS